MNKLLKCQCLKLWVLFQDAVQVIYYKFSSVFHDATASSFHLCTVPTHHTHMPVVHFQMDNVFSRQSLPLIHDMQTEEICLSLLLVIYMETTLIRYISNYLSSEVVELEELMEIKQLIQRQKLERMMKVHKEMRGLDRYREQPKEYKYHDPYDDWIFRQLADIDNRNNIPNTSPQLDFNETDYEDYLKEKWNRGL